MVASPPGFQFGSGPSVGIVGFGAFGRLMATHLQPYCRVCVHDHAPGRAPGQVAVADPSSPILFQTLETTAACDIVVLAVPVAAMKQAVEQIAPHVRSGAMVIDVGSVKVAPAAIMLSALPDHVEILATHPLFGPQSAKAGIRGLKIALCPLRGTRHRRVHAFLRAVLGLEVFVVTPEDHDQEAALTQSLTHLVAAIVMRMEPLPVRITTPSFDLLRQAIAMVRDDAPNVFQAIALMNPYAAEVRRDFFEHAHEIGTELARSAGD